MPEKSTQPTRQRNAFNWPPLRSSVSGIVWPALADQQAAALLSLLAQFEQSQWWSPTQLVEQQSRQLARLLSHAAAHSPFFRERLAHAGIPLGQPVTLNDLQALPLLTRRELQRNADAIYSRSLPADHGGIFETRTSGSTGEPLIIRRSAVSQQFWLALTLREHFWQRRDFAGSLAIIRANIGETSNADDARRGISSPNWGPPVSLLFESGPAHAMNLRTDIKRQAEWLGKVDPHYLLGYPNNISALLDHFSMHGNPLHNLRQIRSIGETLPDELRRRCREVLGVGITDTYSSQEVGVIAIECPECSTLSNGPMYHLMSESLIVEVIDDNGKPCAPGEIGRIVITDLHNFATPLIRYDIRDHAEVGTPCACGRGLPTLRRILGRSRNLVRLPDGRRYWPLTGALVLREVAPIQQFQMIQRDRQSVEVRLVAERAISADEENRLAEIIRTNLGHPFILHFIYFDDELPGSRTGKFEEFVCETD